MNSKREQRERELEIDQEGSKNYGACCNAFEEFLS
jgi:hypothetical protein